MVYTRFVEQWGPYKYKSIRKGDRVISVYLGPADKGGRGPMEAEDTLSSRETLKPITPSKKGPKEKRGNTGQAGTVDLKNMGQVKTKLNNVQRTHLYAFAKANGIDRAEIDHSIGYDENMEYLESLANKRYGAKDLELNKLEASKWEGAYQDFKDQLTEDSETWKNYF